mmetsp:Transcript_25693/g.45019  ORF Transcript_25693/g.45019 Transcript_25693/m.45019 type:complete len:281 (-) Transcript_25693:1925-2767(-)
MDVGTGSVLFSSALVARQARSAKPLHLRFIAALQSCLPLLLIGVIRFYLHKAVDYQEHVSEYGVHWNFFMSLCGVILLSSLFQLSPLSGAALALSLMVAYQCMLSAGLQVFILEAPRTDFFSANREGLCGCLGFFAIYQLGLAVRPLVTDKKNYIVNLWKVTAVAVLFAAVTFTFVEPSRRLNNIAYVSWTVAHNLVCISLVAIAERCCKEFNSQTLGAINFNQLPYFLFSNMLTGVVNLSMQTIFASDSVAISVVLLYQLVACGLMALLHKGRIRLKYW